MDRIKITELLRAKALAADPFSQKQEQRDPNAVIPEIANNVEWLKTIYRDILKMKDMPDSDSGLQFWISKLKSGTSRKEIDAFFRQTAVNENAKINAPPPPTLESLLNPEDKKRLIIVQPESAGDIFLVTSLLPSLRRMYAAPEWTIYFSCKRQFKEIVDGNPNIDHWLDYNPQFDNSLFLEGNSTHKGCFDVALQPYILTQKYLSYINNGEEKIDFNINN
jgi:hypothetical protein